MVSGGMACCVRIAVVRLSGTGHLRFFSISWEGMGRSAGLKIKQNYGGAQVYTDTNGPYAHIKAAVQVERSEWHHVSAHSSAGRIQNGHALPFPERPAGPSLPPSLPPSLSLVHRSVLLLDSSYAHTVALFTVSNPYFLRENLGRTAPPPRAT